MSKVNEINKFSDRNGKPFDKGSVVIFKGGTWAVHNTNDPEKSWVLHPCGVNRESEDVVITYAVASNCEISN